MMLTLQQVENQVLVAARMDEATANLLRPQWQELQRELEAQGIKLAHQDIGNPSNARYQGGPSEEDTSPFHRPSNSQGKQEENHQKARRFSTPFEPRHHEEHEGSLLSYA